MPEPPLIRGPRIEVSGCLRRARWRGIALLLGAMTDRIGATAALRARVRAFLLILWIIAVTQPVLRQLDGGTLQPETSS